ncbi:flagellar FlbD family protein [Ferviditalea candida]|uniref:Flagellar FlbD family protein n=1 Tax=Ferviditalea candida TaxID=3108399 RepID=A0ABU5ZF72_9BACL|nr:flagellar FlbD family protein [Paenibacillaceae bacterium T2]
MITLTRMNGTQITVNALLVESVEATPDTLITLTTGKKIIVLEKVSDVIGLIKNYMRSIGSVRLAIMNQDTEGSQ